jgi:hypothetical protein
MSLLTWSVNVFYHTSLLVWFADVVYHISLLIVFANVISHMSFYDMVYNMSLQMRFVDVDIPDLIVIVCSLDLMVLIHFGFLTLRASCFSNLKLKILK